MHFDFNKRHEEFSHPGFHDKTSPSLLTRNLDNKGHKSDLQTLFFKLEKNGCTKSNLKQETNTIANLVI